MHKKANCKGITQKIQMAHHKRTRDTKLGSGAMIPLDSSQTNYSVCPWDNSMGIGKRY